MPALAPPHFAPGDLDGLCGFIWKRIAWELNFQHDGRPHVYPPLADRLHRVLSGMDMQGRGPGNQAGMEALFATFEADLRELTTVSTDVLRRVVRAGATNARCISAASAAAITAAARVNPGLPRVQPGELVAGFAARGVLVRAVDGALHVTPADALTDADRRLLLAHKAAIVAALSGPELVI